MAEQHKFTKGKPFAFRATTQIHLGKIEKYIMEDDIVMFDGQTLDLGGETHVIPQLRGAVLSGWLVPDSDTTTKYTPQPADIKLRPAQAANITNRGEAVTVTRADNEERVVATLDNKADSTKTADANADARTVGKIQTPAVQNPVLTGNTDITREINKLDNTPPPKATFTKSATGDVVEATVGDELIDILPNAVASTAKTVKPSKAKTANSKSRGRKGNEVVTLRTGESWDMTRHWRTRARDAVRTYSNDKGVLAAIKSVEVPSVVKFIESKLS